jgi:ubiquinone/menaquinone biosynthesis C-methylase UbiE
MNELIEQMRRDWDARAREDAKYYVTCQRRNQNDEDFLAGASDVLARIRRDYSYLRTAVRERRFLEIGCGIGRLMHWLAADCGEIHGIDISSQMIEAGRQRLAHIPHAHLLATQNNDLAAFADSSFDLVYSFAVFQHVPHRTFVIRYLDETLRVLKPGGLFVGQFSGAPPIEQRCDTWIGTWISEAELLRYAKEQGWHVLSSEGVDTQYLWLTMRPPPGARIQSDGPPHSCDRIDP